MAQEPAGRRLEVFLIGGNIVDRSRMAAATATRTGSICFRAVEGSMEGLDAINAHIESDVQQLVVVDLALNGWEGIVSALQMVGSRSRNRRVAVLVGTGETKSLSAARRLGVTGLLLKPINLEHIRLLAGDLDLEWPQS